MVNLITQTETTVLATRGGKLNRSTRTRGHETVNFFTRQGPELGQEAVSLI